MNTKLIFDNCKASVSTIVMKAIYKHSKTFQHGHMTMAKASFLAVMYMLEVNNRNTRARCEICSMLTRKTPERRHCLRSGVFIVNFEHISHLVLVFLLLTLNM